MPTITPTITATPCMTAYSWAYGSVPPEFIERVQQAMKNAGLDGTVKASTFGEDNSCDGYDAMEIDYTFTVNTPDLGAGDELARIGNSIVTITQNCADPCPAPNVGILNLIFQSPDQSCKWDYDGDAWNALTANEAGSITCPAPISPESRRLMAVLGDLSKDLACETSSITANTNQASLYCTRGTVGKDFYEVTVMIQLHGHGLDLGCFHGYKSLTNDTVNMDNERDRSTVWTANGLVFTLMEKITGGPDLAFPQDTNEKLFARAVQAGLVPGEGQDCK